MNQTGRSFGYHIRNILSMLLIAAPFVILIIWYFIKVFQFRSLQVNYADGLLSLQLSRGWLEGRPFMYDTFYGFHFKLHNYYFLPLTGFVTKFTGMYGFFLLYVLLMASLLAILLRWLKKHNPDNWLNGWLAINIFAIGPLAFYVYLDLTGWHPEQYFLPLMGLTAFFLARRKWIVSGILLVLIFSIKETSSVLLCGVLLFISVLNLTLENPRQSWSKILMHRRNIYIVMISLLIFILGMVLLSYLNGPETSRLEQAINNFIQYKSPRKFFIYFGELAISAAVLCTIAILPFIPWLRLMPKGLFLLALLLSYALVLVFVFFVEGLFYYPVFHLSLPFPPRVGSLWAFIFSCYIYMIVRLTESKTIKIPVGRENALLGFSLQLLFFPLLVSNYRSPLPDLDHLGMNIITFLKSGSDLETSSDKNSAQLYSLAKMLPSGSEVVAPDKYLPIFHMAYPCEWDHKHMTLHNPKLYVYEKSLLEKSQDYELPKKGYAVIPNDDLLILVDSTLQYH